MKKAYKVIVKYQESDPGGNENIPFFDNGQEERIVMAKDAESAMKKLPKLNKKKVKAHGVLAPRVEYVGPDFLAVKTVVYQMPDEIKVAKCFNADMAALLATVLTTAVQLMPIKFNKEG